MIKRLALTLASAMALALLPGPARAQVLYLVTPPSTATAPTYAFQSFTLSDPDTGVATLPIGFSFPFYGKSYTSLDVTADGLILFENANPKICDGTSASMANCGTAHDIPDRTPPNALIAFWWDNMHVSGASSTQYAVSGVSPDQIFSIKVSSWEWDDGYGYWSSRTVQVDLHESGVIDIYYGNISSPDSYDGAAAVGIEDSTGRYGVVGLACSAGAYHCNDEDWPKNQKITFSPATKPDLIVTDVIGSPLVATTVAGQPGYQLDVSVTVRNQGLGTATGFTFDLYLCNKPQVVVNNPGQCTLLGSHSTAETLTGISSATFTEKAIQFAKPAGGTFYLGAYVDPPQTGAPNGAVDEALENNNTQVSIGYIIGVDLLGAVSGPANAGPGDDVSMQVTIQNRGVDSVVGPAVDGGASVAFKYQLWVASSTTLDPKTDQLFYTGDIAAIGGGETQQLVPQAQLPKVLADGQYYFILVIDPSTPAKPNGDVTEVDKTNNTAVSSGTLTISAADLLVKDVHADVDAPPYPETTEAFFGQPLRVSFTVQNAGGGTAKDFFVCIYLSDSPVISVFDVDMTPPTAPLADLSYSGGEKHTLDIDALVPVEKAPGRPLADGTYYVGVIADCHNTVPESNKSNNKAASLVGIHIRQPAADFTPSEVQAPAAGAVGELMPIFRVLRNLGNVGNDDPAKAPTVHYRYYLSSNDIISPEDIPLSIIGSDGQPKDYGEVRLAAGGVDRATDVVSIPSQVSPGTYYLGVVVDFDNKFAELDKTNNALAAVGTVEIAASSLRVDTGSLPDGLIGVDYLQELVASGGDGTYAWSVLPDQGDLPAGITLTGSGVLSGQPATAGVAVFTVRVTSGTRETLARLALRTLASSGPLTIVSSSLPTAVKGVDYSAALSAVGGVRPYTWLLTDGTLPDGLLLSQDGTLAGKLTRSLGTVSFKVTVTDSFGSGVVATISMRAVETGTLFIATTTLGKAQVATPFHQRLQATGGEAPYTWALKGGALPDGLRLVEDSIVGTPTHDGYFPFVVEVDDSSGYVDQASFVLLVLAAAAAFEMPTIPEAKLGEAYSLNLSLGAKAHTRFALYSGQLPPVLSMDADGHISGTVPATASPGSYDSLLELTEDSGAQALVPLTIRVLAKPVATTPAASGGCSAAGAGLTPLVVLLFGLPLLLRRRRARVASAALLVAMLLAAAPARADYRMAVESVPFVPLVGATEVDLPTGASEETVPLPFVFRFWGETYTSINVGCRGYLALGTGTAAIAPSLGIPSNVTSFPLIAPWWGSWECAPGGTVSYLVAGVSPQRTITFQWDRVWYTPDTSGKAAHGVTFQARLSETTGKVELAYGPTFMGLYQPPTPDKAPKAAVGIQGSASLGLAGMNCTAAQPTSGTGANCQVADYNDNTLISFTSPADLVPARVYADDVGYAGVAFRVGATVLNQGGEDAKDVTVRFYLTTKPSLDTTHDTVLGTTRPIDLAVQQRRDVLLAPVLPTNLTGTSYYVFAVVDPDNQIAESDESNNAGPTGGRPFLLGAPTGDLAVGDLTMDKVTAKAGDTVKLTRTILNIGNAHLGPCAVPVDCGAGQTCDSSRCRPTCAKPEDCTGGLTCNGTFCDTAACTTADTCLAGEDCSAGACAARPITYSVYLSENAVITAADQKLAGPTDLGSGIPSFGQVSGSDDVQLPADLLPGNYYLGIIVDESDTLPEILVVNNSGATATPLTVVSDALAIVDRTLPDASVLSPYSVHLTAQGGDGSYEFSLATTSTLPAGLALTKTGDLAGIPTVAASVEFDAQVASAGQTASRHFALKVNPANLPLTLLTADIPAAEFGKPYSALLSATGGKPPYAWTLAKDSELPAGVALGQDGTLEGVPLMDGAFAFGVTVTDSVAQTAAQALTLTVLAGDRLRIATEVLPDAWLGKPYDVRLQAVGGKPPVTWSIVQVQAVPSDSTTAAPPATTRLPAPLQLLSQNDGTHLSGTPTAAGSYIVTLKVVDIQGAEDDASWALSLRADHGLEIATVTLPDAIAGKAYLASLGLGGSDGTAKVAWSLTCTPVYNDQGELQPCQQLPPPGITLSTEGSLSTPDVQACATAGCPDGLTCSSTGHCVLKQPQADSTGHVPARTIYSFLVRVEDAATQRSAIKALSITLRVDEALPQVEVGGCSAGGPAAGLLPAVLGLLALLRRPRTRRWQALHLLVALSLAGLGAGLSSCGGKQLVTPSRCDNVTCAATLACDPGDGVCKCGGEGGVVCGTGGACTGGVCVFACKDVVCDRAMTLDPLDCKCKCGTTPCKPGEACDPVSLACYPASKCQGVTCGSGMACDPADGLCKCGGADCPTGQVCVKGACTADPCAGVHCVGGAVCDPADGVCKCGGSAGRQCAFGELCSCPGVDPCKDEERTCQVSARCTGVHCDGGTTCDPDDGKCRCGGPGGPICLYGQSCDVTTKACLGGDRCAGVVCTNGLSCDPEDGTCKCGGLNGVNGAVCQQGDICGHFTTLTSCVTPCDPRTQECDVGLACYFDIYARISYCGAAGKNPEGAGCKTVTDCAKGLHCQQKPGQTGSCRRYCNLPDGPAGCPQATAAQDCYQLEGAPDDVGSCNLTGG